MNTTPPVQTVEPYLFFEGRCEEALDFYREALGAEVTALFRFKESPDSETCPSPGAADKVMHACFKIGQTTMMASDGRCAGAPKFAGFALSITAADAAEAGRLFAALEDGGKVEMPLGETFYSPCFGMVTDRFGMLWMVIVTPETHVS
ncbi:VOC family protein [soil metagenome]